MVQHFLLTLRLHLRNRSALLYGYLFPIIFLAAFWALYRHERIPLMLHLGELLTVSALAGACFGLPITLVAERECGFWQRYQLTPATRWSVLASTLAARWVMVVTAGTLQLSVALAVGMTSPAHPWALALIYGVVSFAFIGLGLVIAGLADNVPAAQALGQCLFLPMLLLGGVAVPIASLPAWAQHVSAYLPGRYAVAALQEAVTGRDPRRATFDLLALAFIGACALIAGAKLFRWSPGRRFRTIDGKAWALAALAAWLVVGGAAEFRSRVSAKALDPAAKAPAPPPVARALEPWEKVTDATIEAMDFTTPSDSGLVTPIAAADEVPDDATDMTLAKLEGELPHWAPGFATDPVQRVQNLLSVAAVVDLLQNPVERFVPGLIEQRLTKEFTSDKRVRVLAWVASHPNDGTVIIDVSDLHLGGPVSESAVRERVQIYATKLLARGLRRKTTGQ
ncbi:MAG: ABC transporter permease [Opitutus sp.]